jgi:hypothetical protein
MAQYGGVARRAAYLRAVRRPGDLTIDLGNLVTVDGPTRQITRDALLESLAALRYDALVPGELELLGGAAFEEALARRPGVRAVCANLRRAGGGAVFDPWLLHRIPDGRTVAVVGVVEPFPDLPPEYRIEPLEESVRQAIAALRGKCDRVVVAGALREDASLALASAFPDAALVLGGWPRTGTRRAVRTNGAPAMLVGEFAWYVGRVDLGPSLEVADSWQAWLDDDVPDDPDLAALVARHDAEVAREGAGFAEKLLASLAARGYAGSHACAECHEEDQRVWERSGHAHAMRVLVEKGQERNPTCVACHLQDLPADPESAPDVNAMGLGCETCHGASARHVELARSGDVEASRRALSPATREGCLRCHFPPNDTHFEFDEAWPKIAHGRK